MSSAHHLMNSISRRALIVSLRPAAEVVEFYEWFCKKLEEARRTPAVNKDDTEEGWKTA